MEKNLVSMGVSALEFYKKMIPFQKKENLPENNNFKKQMVISEIINEIYKIGLDKNFYGEIGFKAKIEGGSIQEVKKIFEQKICK